MHLKKHWLLLVSLILSLLILGIGQASYSKKTTPKNISNPIASPVTQSSKNPTTETTQTQSPSPSSNISKSIISVEENNDSSTTETIQTKNETQTNNSNTNNDSQKQFINFSIESIGNFSVEYKAGDTGWTAMQRAASEHQFTMKYQIYDFGIYVRAIAGIEPEGNSYWSLYHNGAYSMVGIRDLVVEPNDTITWKVETW